MMKETLNNSREGERRLYRSSPELACLKISAVKAAIAAMLMVLLLVPSGFAQLRTSKPKKGPRAIAVVRWQTGPQGKAVPRLVPVLIVEEGKYFDANLFRAAPRPMALEPGVVYEAQDQGDVLGYFTVKTAQSSRPRQWYGLGEYESVASTAAPELRDRTQTAEVVREKKGEAQPGTSPIFTESVDDRDIKKKSTVYDEEGKEIPEGQDKDTGDRPPTLKRKEGDVDRMPQVAPPKKEAPKVQSADDDPERPRLKRGAPSQSGGAGNAGAAAGAGSAPAPASASPSGTAGTKPEDDPNRPRLKRGGSGQQKTGTSETDQSAGTPVPARVQARGDVQPVVKPGAGFATRTFEAVAVSDAEDADKMAVRQDFRFRTSSSEREELLTKMRRIAQDEAMKSLRANGRWPKAAAGPAGARRPQVVAVPALTDAQMAGLDLDSNNSAELVYSGRASLDSGITVFVTVVARTDVDGNPRKLFSSVATSDRLDVTPRLELVDAVDADSDRRGELLFRRIRDNSAEYVLYRVGTDGLTELFHGGAAD